MVTTHTFTDLGLRTMPIGKEGYRLVRNEELKKFILDKNDKPVSFKDAMPSDWTRVYGQQRKQHLNTPLGGLICGPLYNKEESEIEVVALDCDNAVAWEMLRALDPTYNFYFKSIGKEGGTILYELCEDLKDIPQYSIKNKFIHFEFMSKRKTGANAMVYLPTTANETKEQIQKGAELNIPPLNVVAFIKSLEPKELELPKQEQSLNAVLPFNAPLVKQYVLETKAIAKSGQIYGKLTEESSLIEKVYKIFTPSKFRSAEPYQEKGWIHPNNQKLLEIGAYSEYIIGVSAIAGADPSINTELYLDFMQAINAQLDEPYEAKRYITEVIDPMLKGKASINGKPIWRYNEGWDKNSHTIANQYGDTLEYFASELEPNEFLEFNHTTTDITRTKSVSSLLDRIYTMDADPQQDKPSRNLVKKLKLVREEHSVKLDPGIFVNSEGRTIINTEVPCYPLQILRNPDNYKDEVNESNLYIKAFNTFMQHLLGDDEASIHFMKQLLSYHGRHLTNIPIIIYMVGVGGAGKSEFSNILENLFGKNTTRRPSAKQVTSQYNDFLDGCAVLVLSETSDASRRDQEGIKAVLKVVTGEKTADIETKLKPLKPNVPMFALPLLLANDLWYAEDVADRRLFSIIPKKPLASSEPILEFEEEHGLRIMPHIMEGIKLGIISKYLSSFCPKVLPEVPITKAKIDMSAAQSDPINKVKSIVQNDDMTTLFDLFEEYEISLFTVVMESNQDRIKAFLYRQQLVELTKALREGDPYPTDRVINESFTPTKWLQFAEHSKANTNANGVISYKKMGRYKWEIPQLHQRYEDWKLKSLGED